MKIRRRYQIVREPGSVPRLIWTPVTTLGGYATAAMVLAFGPVEEKKFTAFGEPVER